MAAKFQPPNENFRYDDKKLSLTLIAEDAEVKDFHQLIIFLEQGLLKNLRTLRIKGKLSSLATTVLGMHCGERPSEVQRHVVWQLVLSAYCRGCMCVWLLWIGRQPHRG